MIGKKDNIMTSSIEALELLLVDLRQQGYFRSKARALGRIARRNQLGTFGVLLVLVVLLTAAFAPLLQRYDDTESLQQPIPD